MPSVMLESKVAAYKVTAISGFVAVVLLLEAVFPDAASMISHGLIAASAGALFLYVIPAVHRMRAHMTILRWDMGKQIGEAKKELA